MSAGIWMGIGGALDELGQGIERSQVRKLAEEEKRRLEQERKERAALEKAIQQANAAEGLRKENFTRLGQSSDKEVQKRILSDVAMKRKNEEYVDPVSGDMYIRDPEQSPNAVNEMLKRLALQTQEDTARMRTDNARAIAEMKETGVNTRYAAPSGNVQLQEQGRNTRWETPSGNVKVQEQGRNQRWATPSGNAMVAQAGADRRSSTGGGKKTEGQMKAETFSGLMAAAEGELAKNPWGSKPLNAATEIALKGDGKGLVGNAAAALARSRMSPEQQRAVQSRLQFTQAALYAFSGASAPDAEVAKNVTIFFPQSGETDPGLLAQKARMRATATMLLERRKAGAVTGELPLVPDAATGGGGSALSRLNSLGRP